jgi:hypothetical protein
MKVNKEEYLSRPFVLTASDLERICEHFDSSDKFTFRAICADKLVREFTSVADLVHFENVPNKEIEALGINVFSKDYLEKKAFIHLSSRYAFNNILIRLEGEERNVSEQKYSGLIIDIFVTWIFVLPLSYFFVRRSSTVKDFIILIAVQLAFGTILSIIWGRIKGYSFPTGVFAIGQGAKRHEDKDRIRTTVILGFFVSLVAGIVVALMLS